MRRYAEEELTLMSIAQRLEPNETRDIMDQYLELAGNPEQLGNYMAWLHDIALSGLDGVIYHKLSENPDAQRPRGVRAGMSAMFSRLFRGFDHSPAIGQHDRIKSEVAFDTKGVSFELGGAFAMGDPTYLTPVKEMVGKLSAQLEAADSDIAVLRPEEFVTKVSMTPRSHHDDSPRLLDLDASVGVANLVMKSTGEPWAHLVRRSSDIVVGELLPGRTYENIIHGRITNLGQLGMVLWLGAQRSNYDPIAAKSVLPASSVIFARTISSR
jgi:hypothetical protein